MATLRITSIFTHSQFSLTTTKPRSKPVLCSPIRQQVQQQQVDSGSVDSKGDDGVGILCEPCSGRGWLVCDFCKGQKTNVKSETNRFYRRCPSCRAIGYVLCSSCKVFKCVTFPNYNDGEELSF